MLEGKPGVEKYIPSRLEWLAVVLNSFYKAGNMSSNNFKLSYSPSDDQKTIQVNITYRANLDKHKLEEIRSVGRDAVIETAKVYGWDNWVEVKINEQLHPKINN